MNKENLWEKFLAELSKELPAHQFNTWIKPLTCVESNNKVIIYVKNRYVLDYVKGPNLRTQIENSVLSVYGKDVEFQITPRESDRKQESTVPVVSEAIKEIKLPVWADSARGVPNSLLRSALFSVNSKRKVHLKRTVIAAVENFQIKFKNETFNQTDMDVCEGLLHIARNDKLGNKVCFSAYAFLKILGRGIGRSQYEQLKDEVSRLMGGVVEINDLKGKTTFIGTLLRSAKLNEETKQWEVSFEEDLLKLYEGGYTVVDWEQRMMLGRNNLAKWLHGHYASHAKPLPYKVETIKEMCGSDITRLVDFRSDLKKAHDALKAVGAIDSWEIDKNDLVHVNRTPSDSQRRHLAKNQPTRTNKTSSNTVLGHLSKPKR